MDDTRNTIGLSELLDEVGRDLAEFRRKHPGDYQLKNVTMWWELEQERLQVRHAGKHVRRPRRFMPAYRSAIWFLLGCTIVLLAIALLRSA